MRWTPCSRTVHADVMHDDEWTLTPDCPACEYAKRPVMTRGRPSQQNRECQTRLREDILTERGLRAQQTTTCAVLNCCGNPNIDIWEHRRTKGA